MALRFKAIIRTLLNNVNQLFSGVRFMSELKKRTNDYQEVNLVIGKVPNMTCQKLNSEEKYCDCNDGIDWENCEHFGFKISTKIDIKDDYLETQLEEYRDVIFTPIFEHYDSNLKIRESDGTYSIFLSIAPRHHYFQLPNETDYCRYENKNCKDRRRKKYVESWKKSKQKDIKCIPMLPFELCSRVNIHAMVPHFRECLDHIHKKYSNEKLEIHTYYGSGNMNIRAYLQALMKFYKDKKNSINGWDFFDYLPDNDIEDLGPEARFEEGFHLLPSLPFLKV